MDQSASVDLLPAALDRGVGVVNAGIFNSGLLSRPRPEPGAHYDYRSVPQAVVERTTRMALVCEEHGVDLPTAAVAFAGRHPAVVSVVVGLRTADQVRELAARQQVTVPDELWDALTEQGLLEVGVRA